MATRRLPSDFASPSSSQRLDPQVAVDQHEPSGVVDHHHRHLLPDLDHRADQPSALLAVVNPQIAVPELELVEIDCHAVNLRLPEDPRRLVLPCHPTNSGEFMN